MTTAAPANPKVRHQRTTRLDGPGRRYLLEISQACDWLEIEVLDTPEYDPERGGPEATSTVLGGADLYRSPDAGPRIAAAVVLELPEGYDGPAFAYVFPHDVAERNEAGRPIAWESFAGGLLGPSVDADADDFSLRVPLPLSTT